MSLLQKFNDSYSYVFEDISDPRVKSFFLMSSPVPILCIVGFYLYFVLKLGPRLMKNRPPFDLEKVLIIYNLIQILACIYLIIKLAPTVLFTYSFTCEPVDYSNNEVAVAVTKHTWQYFMLKVIDLLDTVFFVLRKKNNQISFLHLYHHTGMCLLGWIGTKYFAGGHGILLELVNCIVHTIMYYYYLLSAWDKEYKKNVWWKKHITQLQIGQFMILFVYFGQILFQPNCNYPKWVVSILVVQDIFIISLFMKFYIKTYIKPQKTTKNKNNNTPSIKENGLNKHEKQM